MDLPNVNDDEEILTAILTDLVNMTKTFTDFESTASLNESKLCLNILFVYIL